MFRLIGASPFSVCLAVWARPDQFVRVEFEPYFAQIVTNDDARERRTLDYIVVFILQTRVTVAGTPPSLSRNVNIGETFALSLTQIVSSFVV